MKFKLSILPAFLLTFFLIVPSLSVAHEGRRQLEDLGYNIAIFPATALRLAMGAVRAGLTEMAETGTILAVLVGVQRPQPDLRDSSTRRHRRPEGALFVRGSSPLRDGLRIFGISLT